MYVPVPLPASRHPPLSSDQQRTTSSIQRLCSLKYEQEYVLHIISSTTTPPPPPPPFSRPRPLLLLPPPPPSAPSPSSRSPPPPLPFHPALPPSRPFPADHTPLSLVGLRAFWTRRTRRRKSTWPRRRWLERRRSRSRLRTPAGRSLSRCPDFRLLDLRHAIATGRERGVHRIVHDCRTVKI